MTDITNIGESIFKQICEVNDLDPEKIRDIAQKQQSEQKRSTDEAEHLIRTAFNHKAQSLIKKLDLGSTSENKSISDGKEYAIGADPTAPSFVINEEFIHSKYSEDEAKRLIDALGKIMLPIRA